MHKLTMYESLRDKVESELSTINDKGVTDANLEHLYKLTMSLKALDKHICLLEEYEAMDDYSYNKGKRFSMTYANAMNPPHYRYSRDMAKSRLVGKLETMMADAGLSEEDRMHVQNCIEHLS